MEQWLCFVHNSVKKFEFVSLVKYALNNFLSMIFLMVSEGFRAYFISGGREHEKIDRI